MVREKFKWEVTILLSLLILNEYTKCLPIETTPGSYVTPETAFTNSNLMTLEMAEDVAEEDRGREKVTNATRHAITRNTLLRNVRPGQEVRQYAVELTIKGNEFSGRAIIDVVITEASMDDSLLFHFEGLSVQEVKTGVFTVQSAVPADFSFDDGILEIEPAQNAATFIVVVDYTGSLANAGQGLYVGQAYFNPYIAMNLHPTNARRVFPCMDEPTEAATITMSFRNVQQNHITTNSDLDEASSNDDVTKFRPLQGPPHLWGMIAHDFNNVIIPTPNVDLFVRPSVTNQESQAAIATNAYFNYLNTWTEKSYFEIIVNQNRRLSIVALPDVDREWNALSNIGIWEPHMLMESGASAKQRNTVLVKIAEALAKQWFGYVVYPQNWRHQWVISGLSTHAAYQAFADFQTPTAVADVTLFDVNTLFVTEVIQESLLRDAHIGAQLLEPSSELFDEEDIRYHLNGLVKYKSPAMMHFINLIIGNNIIRTAARALLAGRALQTVSTQNFNDAVNSIISQQPNLFIEDLGEFLDPWLHNSGYPLIHVGLRQGGVLLTQEYFTFASKSHVSYDVPLSYTTSINPNFANTQPILNLVSTTPLNMALGEDDWVLFNIQGQGYYRVNYDSDLWERIIDALEDPDRRSVIHPLNRATLIDDALNLARAGRLDYDIAFRVVLSMQHETEYAVWRAFVRNMDFLRKRLIALVTDDDDLDPDIYVRMIRRTIGSVEEELGFQPDPLLTESSMASLTRGLVMDHACRSDYEPCIAAAVDWFYDPNNKGVVNPNIPQDLRPAVYCAMVKEGDDAVIEALEARLEIEPSLHERLVILESFACSQNGDFVRGLLEETVTAGNRFFMEERVKIFKAVAESSLANAWIAVNFMSRRTGAIRFMYGGSQKLEESIFILADNILNADLATDFRIWANAQNNNLDDSQDAANAALAIINENLEWDNKHKQAVYEWIDENAAPTLAVSLLLVSITLLITLFN